MYKAVSQKVSFSKQEEEILKFWKDNDTFKKSISQRDGCDEYTFYDGPPFATGLPHFGHFIPSTIKDIIPRYMAMCGKKVVRRFGWDCHGLPVENLIEKELGLNSKHEIEAYGVAAFNEKCRASVLKYTTEWRQTIERMGRWVDFDHDYKTMEASYMESIWWVAKTLWNKGLIYEGKYILPYCPRCSTVLSTHELAQGYKERKDPAVTIRFLITSGNDKIKDIADGKTYFLAWTTTPWTLPSNEGLCMGPDIDYALVKDNESNDKYIMATKRIAAYYKTESEYQILWEKKGKEFLDIKYEPLFNYFAYLKAQGAFRMFNAEYVSTEDGTGIVHIAPAFGEEDSKVFIGSNIDCVEPMDAECRFTKDVSNYAGRFVKDCDNDIIIQLKKEGKLIKKETITHQYPHCWRCSQPLIYRGIGSWFVKVADYHDKLLKANAQIKWQPQHIKEGRFGKWLAGSRDWAISRGRYWGNPIPIWRCSECGNKICIGSRQELKELSGQNITDLHKQFVDKIEIKCNKCGSVMKRIPEVFDCWFESGSMPYAQEHYPFENKTKFEKNFPADFISEGLDQTRGWFYTLTILAAHLFDSPAFKNCIVNGIVLAQDGRKMSKSLRNYTDPVEAINQLSADAIRLFLMHSAVVKAEEIRYSDDAVKDVIKSFILPLWSSYSFFVQYANIDAITCTGCEFDSRLPDNPLDRWILSVSQRMLQEVTKALDDYDLSGAIDPMFSFIEDLNNWYIRRSRRRFWRSGSDNDKKDAYGALYAVLRIFVKVAAPFIPFLTEEIWQNLHTSCDKESVHLCDWPQYNNSWRDTALEFKMSTVQKAISMGHSLRNEFNIKNRQPLESVALVTRNADEKRVLTEMEDSIREELNVKHVIFHDREDELVEYQTKANFRVLGSKLGSSMKEAATKIANFTQEEIESILEGSKLSIEIAGKTVDIDKDCVLIQRIEKNNLKVLNDGTLTVGLDTKLTDDLRHEGLCRDLVRGIQNLRKTSGLEIVDRIQLQVSGSEELHVAFDKFKGFIAAETLATTIQWQTNITDATSIETDTNIWQIKLQKA